MLMTMDVCLWLSCILCILAHPPKVVALVTSWGNPPSSARPLLARLKPTLRLSLPFIDTRELGLKRIQAGWAVQDTPVSLLQLSPLPLTPPGLVSPPIAVPLLSKCGDFSPILSISQPWHPRSAPMHHPCHCLRIALCGTQLTVTVLPGSPSLCHIKHPPVSSRCGAQPQERRLPRTGKTNLVFLSTSCSRDALPSSPVHSRSRDRGWAGGDIPGHCRMGFAPLQPSWHVRLAL